MKRPSFQFYPGDWLNDVPLRMVSASARGLWIDMICLMHQGSEYGYLKVNHEVIQKVNLARLVGLPLDEVITNLAELERSGIFSRDERGCIFSRRMIGDERLRRVRAECGKLSQNNPNVPRTKDTNKDNQKDNQKDNLESKTRIPLQPSPSSSSSSSSSKLKESTKEKASRLSEDFELPFDWISFYFKEKPDSDTETVNLTFCKFKDYWIAKPGKDGIKLNWFATWRNWIRREKDFKGYYLKKGEKFDPIAYANRNNKKGTNEKPSEKDITDEVVRTD